MDREPLKRVPVSPHPGCPAPYPSEPTNTKENELMPRRPKQEKQTITVIVNGAPVGVTLHPPTNTRKSWYAYWPGLVSSKSTGQRRLEDAIVVAENMVKTGGKRADVRDTALSDAEFEAIQRAHFAKKT